MVPETSDSISFISFIDSMMQSTWPVFTLCDERCSRRVGKGVEELVEDVLSRLELDLAGLFAGPEILPPAEGSVQALGGVLEEPVSELWDSALGVSEQYVDMI